ncbi:MULTISPECIES: hypothetical protein [Acinetobacter]|uniref:Uncharacterized protein n=1 Tax=Acinetobacter higginsii TaxID=70347 RepID=N9SF90_9GAMM|nr:MULTISPECIES: hypothetical protein [Acinetobacter]ENX53241.1 hypothetical protein F902_04110 [Acinetobacter higginsii]
MDDKTTIEVKVILQAIKGKIEIFNEMEAEEKTKESVNHHYLLGASQQTLRVIEGIVDKELSKIESSN